MWEQFSKTIQVNRAVGEPLPKPTKDDIHLFEKEHVFQLPTTYAEFVMTFGGGEICEFFHVYSPNHGGDLRSCDLDAFVTTFEKNRQSLTKSVDDKLCKRFFPFAGTIDGDVIGWDPEIMTDQQKKEYAIFVITRRNTRLVRLSDSFLEFVENVCLGNTFAELGDYTDWEIVREFTPYGKR